MLNVQHLMDLELANKHLLRAVDSIMPDIAPGLLIYSAAFLVVLLVEFMELIFLRRHLHPHFHALR